jgi:hypothetical protein
MANDEGNVTVEFGTATGGVGSAGGLQPQSGVGGGGPNNFELLALGKCLDVYAFETHNGARPVIWDCNGFANQRWILTPQGEIRGWGNKCLDVYAFQTHNGAPVKMWDCNGLPNQKWSVTPWGGLVGYGGKCLDVPGWNRNTGADLHMWDCYGGDTQQWTVAY